MTNISNPNLPASYVQLNSFNLQPGAAFMILDEPDPRVWVAERVVRDATFENVHIWAHDIALAEQPGWDLPVEGAFVLDYCLKVALVGLVVNHIDPDDTDAGANLPSA